MRFFLFDRVLEYKAGESSCGIKNVSIQEEFLIDHYERQPLMPSPLIVEALAQLGGWTVTTSGEHRYLAVMVRIKG
ncbi:MAG: beta-hydroxyacyl-ACP dehydratase, partial [Deltaproteobacteria bacterium]|nr:beta-hydroxyacyl-ACP dehydratase [Deltaproteobacteria bacterium]